VQNANYSYDFCFVTSAGRDGQTNSSRIFGGKSQSTVCPLPLEVESITGNSEQLAITYGNQYYLTQNRRQIPAGVHLPTNNQHSLRTTQYQINTTLFNPTPTPIQFKISTLPTQHQLDTTRGVPGYYTECNITMSGRGGFGGGGRGRGGGRSPGRGGRDGGGRSPGGRYVGTHQHHDVMCSLLDDVS